ncbi:Uncharacterised protein [Odoribacter splanchnicus]|uniref:hypothetical protein n=1 Tax=Odoribacter splanchnicus TaxID=28118 RepID=UPI000D866CA8|nr:hypothetical protein [Odoribacter splanchnicus]SPY23641.1 Uncharacterised protein [Odoribacter splanchnicus]
MKIRILSDFRDKYDYSRLYKAGDVVKFQNERAKELVKLGLAEPLREKEEEIEDKEESPEEEEKPRTFNLM